MKYQIFGSEDSIDIDVLVLVDNIGSIQECHEKCKLYNTKLKEILNTEKEINTNLGVLGSGLLVDCFKGTVDEVNNSVYHTYSLHNKEPNFIERPIERNVKLKIERCIRTILTFWSRSEHRKDIKECLREKDLLKSLLLISSINSKYITTTSKNNLTFKDYCKCICFQLTQTLALMEGKELYTKKECYEYIPEFKPYLLRDNIFSLSTIEHYKRIFCERAIRFI